MIKNVERKLEAVVAGARAILEKKNFQESARAIFDYCCLLTGAVSGYVALLSSDGDENEVLFLEAGGMSCSVDENLPMPIRGLREEAYRTHKTVYENNFMDTRWVKFMPPGHVVLNNVMFAPLNIDNKTVGIIGLANKPSDFTKEDSELAGVFGDLAAIALLNSRYLETLTSQKESLERALAQVKTLSGLLPICSHCKNIRDDAGFWKRVDSYIAENSDATFTHGICPECLDKYFPQSSVASNLDVQDKKEGNGPLRIPVKRDRNGK